jgi:acetylglutamate kinase
MILTKPHPSIAVPSSPLTKNGLTASRVAILGSHRRGGLCVTAASVAEAQPSLTSSPTTVDTAAAMSRVDVLSEALPFIQRFKGKTIVVKYGSAVMKSPKLQELVIRDLVLLSCVGVRPMLVHGGRPEINSCLTRVGVECKGKANM